MLIVVPVLILMALVWGAAHMLRRGIASEKRYRISGWKITTLRRAREMSEVTIPFGQWMKCLLPWPGKRRWADTVITKVALLGGVIEYTAVSAFDWDEAWTIELGNEIIASSNRVATGLMFLQEKGIKP